MTDLHLTVLIALRWLHITTAMLWIGTSYFMNFVLAPAARRLEGDARRQALPGILERALFWLKWGALATYVTGWSYLLYKCYGESSVGFHGPDGLGHTTWGRWIAIGVVLGTALFINVWWVICPAQTRVIAWMRSGETPAEMPRLAARVEKVSKINTYLSVPLIFTMASASHLPVINGWIIAAVFAAGFAIAAHFYLIASKVSQRS